MMNPTPTHTLGTVDEMRDTLRRISHLKGRQPDAQSLQDVRALLSQLDRRDLLIEHLHVLNDTYRGLFERHLVALAHAMKLPLAEVYEVATFYHHFEVLPNDANPAELTVRVGDGLSCELSGAKQLLAKLPNLLGKAIRVIAAPCVGRCEQAPVAVVHQNPVPHATPELVAAAVNAKQTHQAMTDHVDFDAYVADGGYRLVADLHKGITDTEQVLKAMEDSGLRGLGGAGFPAGRKWRIVREQPAPRLMAVNIDEGEPGTFKVGGRPCGGHRCGLYLFARRVPRLPRATHASLGALASPAPMPFAAHRVASRCRCLYLRRGVRHD
jgi:formate dehydrogenase